MRHRSQALLLYAAITLAVAGCGGAVAVPVATAKPLVLPISADDLRRDLMVFASDSFEGRETGTPGAFRAARFIAQRLVTLGAEPAGDSMYFQRVPMVRERLGPDTRLTVTQGVSTSPLGIGAEVAPFINIPPGGATKRNAEGDITFAGYGLDTLGRHDFAHIKEARKVIVMIHGAPPEAKDAAARKHFESQSELERRMQRALAMFPAAIVVLMAGGTTDFYTQAVSDMLRPVSLAPGDNTTSDAQRPIPMVVLGLARPGSLLLPSAWPTDDRPQDLTGRRFRGSLDVRKEFFTGYNVAAIVRGTDARLNKTYVAFGAHYDHVGVQSGSKPDSISNGADDDGSGSMAMLAIAKSLTTSRPKRSALFVWHVGEEKGLLGSNRYVDHPTVPIDSIVAMLNADMIGRRGGSVTEWDTRTQGAQAADRLYVVGPRAAPNDQSKVLGAILDTVNARQLRPMQLDHEWDTPTHPEKIYYRSDHFHYARKGIPIVFFTTGLHEDYHKVSDEPAKIDYEKMARVGSLLLELGVTLANRETRPR